MNAMRDYTREDSMGTSADRTETGGSQEVMIG